MGGLEKKYTKQKNTVSDTDCEQRIPEGNDSQGSLKQSLKNWGKCHKELPKEVVMDFAMKSLIEYLRHPLRRP